MKKIILSVIIFIFGLTNTVLAQTAIKAEVDKTRISTEETLTYKITVNSAENKIPQPSLPKFEGFKVITQLQSQTISLGKGKTNLVTVYAFVLMPVKVGKFKIAPASLKTKNNTYSTPEIEIEVTQEKTQPQLPQEPRIPQTPEAEPETGLDQITL